MVHVVCALVAFLLAIQSLQGCGRPPGNCPDDDYLKEFSNDKLYNTEEACEADHGCCNDCVIDVVENITTTSTVDGITTTTEQVEGHVRYFGESCPYRYLSSLTVDRPVDDMLISMTSVNF